MICPPSVSIRAMNSSPSRTKDSERTWRRSSGFLGGTGAAGGAAGATGGALVGAFGVGRAGAGRAGFAAGDGRRAGACLLEGRAAGRFAWAAFFPFLVAIRENLEPPAPWPPIKLYGGAPRASV